MVFLIFQSIPEKHTGGSNEIKSSTGLTVNLNCPFLLSKRRRMELEGGMAALGSEVSPALFHEGNVNNYLQSKEFENMIRKCYVTNTYST